MFWCCFDFISFFFLSFLKATYGNKGPQQAFLDPGFDLLEAGRDSAFWIAESLYGTRGTENNHQDYGIKRKFGSGLEDLRTLLRTRGNLNGQLAYVKSRLILMKDEDDEGVEKQVHCTRAGLLINSTHTFACKFLLFLFLDLPVRPHSQSRLRTLTDEFIQAWKFMQKSFNKSAIYPFLLQLQFFRKRKNVTEGTFAISITLRRL